MSTRWTALFGATVVAGVLATGAGADDDAWHRTLDDGLKAGKKSGRPLLVVTIWKPDV